jgi:hypothetical protein
MGAPGLVYGALRSQEIPGVPTVGDSVSGGDRQSTLGPVVTPPFRHRGHTSSPGGPNDHAPATRMDPVGLALRHLDDDGELVRLGRPQDRVLDDEHVLSDEEVDDLLDLPGGDLGGLHPATHGLGHLGDGIAGDRALTLLSQDGTPNGLAVNGCDSS